MLKYLDTYKVIVVVVVGRKVSILSSVLSRNCLIKAVIIAYGEKSRTKNIIYIKERTRATGTIYLLVFLSTLFSLHHESAP